MPPRRFRGSTWGISNDSLSCTACRRRPSVRRARSFWPPPTHACLLLFVLDQEQWRGFVIWDASWVGGSLRLRRTVSDWELETVGDWIT